MASRPELIWSHKSLATAVNFLFGTVASNGARGQLIGDMAATLGNRTPLKYGQKPGHPVR